MEDSGPTRTGLEIAIIGMAGRFPKAPNIEAFWQNLCQGVDAVSFFSEAELQAAGIPLATLRDPAYVRAAALLENVDLFDAAFFGITPREAEVLDPQQRLLLECAWETLENAGYDPEKFAGPIGVYAGARLSGYLLNNLGPNWESLRAFGHTQVFLNNDKDYVATRISYKLNLRGPSLNVNTACSTSLVTVHLACQALLSGACDMALAGGVGLLHLEKTGYLYREGGIYAPDGHCRAFDAKAQGTVGGNGLGMVALKRLEDALEAGDYIHAVIKGSALNNDGALKVGFTAPSVDGQAQVIRAAQIMAEVEPETITYIEAHGTGTPLGDPIEIAALNQVFRAHTSKKAFCAVGAVKSNVGHLDAAAGVTGLIKTALALKHQLLPPTLHFEQPNPKLGLEDSPFYINAQLQPWPAADLPRRAAVSSFGIGGTNAHIILEEAPPRPAPAAARPWQLLLLSARTESALAAASHNLANYLKQHPTAPLADVAYTLQVGRRAFEVRQPVVCSDAQNAVEALTALSIQAPPKRVRPANNRPVVFMFSGQGAQYPNMGLGLYQSEAAFREQIDHCAELLRPHLGLDIRQVLYPTDATAQEAAAQKLQQTLFTQPALFVTEYALAHMWQAWGVQPRAMIGHSIGEFVAACLAGVFSLEDALALVVARAQLMHSMPSGTMLAVPLTEEVVQPLLGPDLSLAAINAPARCVVSGPTEAIEALERQLEAQQVACRRLHTSHAFHSAMMAPIVAPFVAKVRQSRPQPPQMPYISNVTGTWITAAEATSPDYWGQHLRQAVRFADGLQALAQEPKRVLLEVGPGQTLATLAKQQLGAGSEAVVLASLRHPQQQATQPDLAFGLTTLGQLWAAGVNVDWAGFYANEQRQRVPLPTYPFERKRYWIDAPPLDAELSAAPVATPASATSASVATVPALASTMPTLAPTVPALAPTAPALAEPAPTPWTDFAAWPEAEASAADPLEHLINQQLAIMAQQLAVLSADS